MFRKYKPRVRIKTVRSDDTFYFMLWSRDLEYILWKQRRRVRVCLHVCNVKIDVIHDVFN